MTHRVGVCSWSLLPTGPGDLVDKVRDVGVRYIQLALDPIRLGVWDEDETIDALGHAGIEVLSGMIGMKDEDYSSLESIRRTGGVRLTENWEENLATSWRSAKLASRLGLSLVTFHAGYLPADESHPERTVLIERVRAVADCFAAEGIDVGLETGQEDAPTMLSVLQQIERPRVGVNFDPANMILYGNGNPEEALTTLAPYVKQLHVKDAKPATQRGHWGTETVAGAGAVVWSDLLERVERIEPAIDFVIEREGGDKRVKDVKAALRLLQGHGAAVA